MVISLISSSLVFSVWALPEFLMFSSIVDYLPFYEVMGAPTRTPHITASMPHIATCKVDKVWMLE
jgi:hypothetical protein